MVGERTAVEYGPGRPFYAAFGISLAILLPLGFYVAYRYEWNEGAGVALWVWVAGLLASAIFVPGLVQHLVLRRLGATPERVGWAERGNSRFFSCWWRAPGHRFTRSQFALAYCVPNAIFCAIVLAYVFTFPGAAPIVAFILPYQLGNFWSAFLVLRRPRGTAVERSERGLRFYGPSVSPARPGSAGEPRGYPSG